MIIDVNNTHSNDVLTYMLSDFLTTGYVRGRMTSDIAQTFEHDVFIDCNSTLAEQHVVAVDTMEKLLDLHARLATDLVGRCFSRVEKRECGLWHGVDTGSAVWHNDYKGEDGFNSNILIYMEDGEDNGNSISVTDGYNETTIFPRRNDFVWLNQSKPHFKHKATHTRGIRRLLSFDFMIHDLKQLWT